MEKIRKKEITSSKAMTDPVVNSSFQRLKHFCESENFKGYDPYDGLNSKVFQKIPFVSSSRLMRLAWIQFFKRMPFNLRPIFQIEKDYNPKALGLFLSSYCLLYEKSGDKSQLDKITFLIDKILDLSTPGWAGRCWGYNFDWQARAFYQPKYTPTVVASTFIANALLDAYDTLGDENLLVEARSTCNFILEDLNRTKGINDTFAFSYSPLDTSVVFNASLLGSRLLARVYHHTQEAHLLNAARSSVDYCCEYQRKDGSWSYGTNSFHQWIDNFHTGYNLECLHDFSVFANTNQYQECLSKGMQYYLQTFFTEEGIAKYYNNSTYPIDIHAPSQLIITLKKLNKLEEYSDLVSNVLHWTINNMQDRQGYFHFQIHRYYRSKIPYIRWAQAWMFYALATLLVATDS